MQQSETGKIPAAGKLTAELLGIGTSVATFIIFVLIAGILIAGDEIVDLKLLLLLYVVVMVLLTPSYVVIGQLVHRLTDRKGFLKWNMCIFGGTIGLLLLSYLLLTLFTILFIGAMVGQ